MSTLPKLEKKKTVDTNLLVTQTAFLVINQYDEVEEYAIDKLTSHQLVLGPSLRHLICIRFDCLLLIIKQT